jgi:molybdenum cofactor cytidylyltransferase
MGQPKQLLSLHGRPMVRLVTEAVCRAGLAQVVVVVGAGGSTVARALEDLPVEILVNDSWATGLSSSIHLGIEALRPEIEAVVMVLADQPGLKASLIESLMDRYASTGAQIVAPIFEGKRGNPVLFSQALFPELLQVQGDQGGRWLIERHRDLVERVAVADPAVLMDIDTPEDYRSASALV